jgi:uncharacterized protein YbjT (DUF2867 family)
MAEKKVLIAGATGYLGQYLVQESKKQGYWIRALTRNAHKLAHLRDYIDDIFVGQVTDRDSISKICQDIDFVVSAVGITRQKDGLTYMDVDYQGNRNLLDRALSNDVSKFIYVSVFNAQFMQDLKIIQAKERFVRELTQSALDHTIIRPTGFFSDMLEFLTMAEKGKVNLFGSGEYRINPIHGQDLADVCVDAILSSNTEIEVGGPETFTHRQIAELAFDVLQKDAKISCMPLWLKNMILWFMRLFTSSKTFGPVEFLMTALSMDGVAPPYGEERLRDFFEKNVDSLGEQDE